jgi:hypothetical protein
MEGSGAMDLAGQVASQWSTLLSMMTAQGATRAQIAGVSLAVGAQIIGMTGEALWPDQWPDADMNTAPPGEGDLQTRVVVAYTALEAAMAAAQEVAP